MKEQSKRIIIAILVAAITVTLAYAGRASREKIPLWSAFNNPAYESFVTSYQMCPGPIIY